MSISSSFEQRNVPISTLAPFPNIISAHVATAQ